MLPVIPDGSLKQGALRGVPARRGGGKHIVVEARGRLSPPKNYTISC